MPIVSEDVRKDFGRAVKRARSLKPWTADQLGAAMDPPVGKSFISKVERGTKEAIDTRTVGRFIKALNLDESWIDKFLDAETGDESDETKSEQDADRVVSRLQRSGETLGNSEDLLILLANDHTDGTYRDLETAYIAVRESLRTLERMKSAGTVPDNADGQYQALMAEVYRLNQSGERDAAAEALDDAMARNEQIRAKIFQDQLDQDRIRNRPDLAAKRLIKDLQGQEGRGKLFWAVNTLSVDWCDQGQRFGDMFRLRVALALARDNYERRSKGKRGLEAAALHQLGWCYRLVGERAVSERPLELARNALEGSVKKTETQDRVNWAARVSDWSSSLRELGERREDIDVLHDAVNKARRAIGAATQQGDQELNRRCWLHFGLALLKLGEATGNADVLKEAVDACTTRQSFTQKTDDQYEWEIGQSNLGLAQRWLGAVTQDLGMLQTARETYVSCENVQTKFDAPFSLAQLHWNIADLALARYELEPDTKLLAEARDYVSRARAFFVDGSEHQTERCDALIAKLEAFEADAA